MIIRMLHFLCCSLLYFTVCAETIDVRLSPNFYDHKSSILYVDVELKYNGRGEWVLADQNYRLYYDASSLQFIKGKYKPDLPHDLYSDLHFIEIVDRADASEVGNLAFDHHLGFLNFNVDLLDDNHGGLRVRPKDGWVRVLTLKFKVSRPEVINEIVWSTKGRTDGYATAFVEIMQWKSPNAIEPAIINRFVDAQFDFLPQEKMAIEIGPNPTTEFVQIRWKDALAYDHTIIVFDGNGSERLKFKVVGGLSDIRVDMSELSAGRYLINILDDHQLLFSEAVVKLK